MPGWDFVNNDAHPNDDESHGTHVAGTIAQTTNNATGVAGIAYNVSLMPVKVLNAQGSGTISQIADGIRWAADHGAHVINMSFGTSALPAQLIALQDAVQYAASLGVVLVAASGNSSGATPMYPAAYPEVISVGATLFNKSLATYSNKGSELCTPGGTSNGEDVNGDGYPDMILQNTFDPNTHATCSFGYWFFAGTSMASPHVAAVAALIKSEQPSLTAAEIRQLLHDTADNTVTPDCGFGLVDAQRALEAAAVGDHPPTASIFKPTAGSMLAGSVTIQISAADAQTPAADLVVEWSRDGTSWQLASYNAGSRLLRGRLGHHRRDRRQPGDAARPRHRQRDADDRGDAGRGQGEQPNQPPVAAFSYSCTSNVCSFNASASSDADGTTLGYAWSFGDGQSGAGKTVSHTFTATGTYVVNLTVTDELGATGAHAENVTIQSINNTSHVSDLDGVGRRLFLGFWEARITIRIADTLNRQVSNARVTGLFNDGTSLFQCTTNASGSCTVSGYQLNLSCLTFTVTSVTHATLKYQPAQNADPDGDSNGTQITVCRP